MVRVTLLIASALLLCMPAAADTVTVSQTVNYQNNHNDANGPWFIPPDSILDHDPYHRGSLEDWGWTHDMSSLVPTGATGITSATLKIRTWDVTDDVDRPADDRIYAIRTSGGVPVTFQTSPPSGDNVIPISLPATLLGSLAPTLDYDWGATTFTILNLGVLGDLWSNGASGIFMNINEANSGRRITLAYSTLTVDYTVPHTTWEPSMPVYRFYSPKTGAHFYTTKESEKTKIITIYPETVWKYEGIAYYTYPDKRNDSVSPVYRFWSAKLGSHFFTISETEKDKLLAYCTQDEAKTTGYPSTWTYEGIAFYAHPPVVSPDVPPAGSKPVYRFWSPKLGYHFFTMTESEKDKLMAPPFSDVWTYEGIAWYAYE